MKRHCVLWLLMWAAIFTGPIAGPLAATLAGPLAATLAGPLAAPFAGPLATASAGTDAATFTDTIAVTLTDTTAAAPARADSAPILVFGDSESAGYGLAHVDDGWVGMLRAKLKSEGYGVPVVNASVSGETTAGGLARLPRALQLHHPSIVILELGGNDGLRALPLDQMQENLRRMVRLSVAAGARVLLLGMRIPPNYGPEYTDNFANSFARVAKLEGIPLVPFLLADVALSPALMQADGVHANEQGQPKLLGQVWPALKPMLRK